MKAVRVHEFGGPDVLRLEDLPLPEPATGEARIRVEAIGVNFADIYRRKGQYPSQTPFILGSEAAGIVDAVGPDVADLKTGDRVASASLPGAYAEYVTAPAHVLVPVPEHIDAPTAAAVMLQGMTAHYLTHSTYPLKQGDTTLIHAAAGGVGLLLTQIAKKCGARVIGTVSTEEKAALARSVGADEIIMYTKNDFASETRRLTDNRGVDVVYDSVGQSTFDGSLNSLRPRGYMVLYGQSSGPVPPFDLQVLNAKGSLFITRPTLGHYIANQAELLQRASDLFSWISTSDLNARIDTTFPLAEVAEAHRYLEERKSKGKVLLVP